MDTTLESLSLTDLKCLVYDESQIIHALRQQMEEHVVNVQALNQEIARRATAAHTAAEKESAQPRF